MFDRTLRNEVQIKWSPTKTVHTDRQIDRQREAKAMMEMKRKMDLEKERFWRGPNPALPVQQEQQEQFRALSQMGRGIAAQCDTRQCAYRPSFLVPRLR